MRAQLRATQLPTDGANTTHENKVHKAKSTEKTDRSILVAIIGFCLLAWPRLELAAVKELACQSLLVTVCVDLVMSIGV